MRISSFSVLALGFGFAAAFTQLSACSNSSDDCNATATCGNTAGTSHAGTAGKSSGGGGSGADAGATSGGTPTAGGSMNTGGTTGASGMGGAGGEGGSAPKPCTGDVSDDAACWTSNQFGVFVSSESGDDAAGDGTKELPFATIAKGIAAAAAASKNIYICLGAIKDTYAEKVSLDASVDGLRIYGGFECADWSYSTTRKSSVVSPEVIALRIASLKKGVYIENLRFTAADGNGTDASSYGAFVTDSKNVMLKRVELTAGKGLKGANGVDGDPGPDGTKVPSADGTPEKGKAAICLNPPSIQAGGTWGATVSCGSSGGNGGVGRNDGALSGGHGDPGLPASNVNPPGVDNSAAGATTLGDDAAPGNPGSPGLPGAVGSKAFASGIFSVAGFSAAGGKDGSSGHVGQGGGGGGGSKGNGTCTGASGGAGGMGGCGGKPGTAGQGGGASVGLFVWGSELSLLACSIVSLEGGPGGHGGAGGLKGQGQNGAPGGLGAALVGDGGGGGKGGDGGDGGSGSGGTGGPAYALVYSGTQPSYDLADTTLKVGKGGAAGVGGTLSNVKAPDGSVGDAAAEFMVP